MLAKELLWELPIKKLGRGLVQCAAYSEKLSKGLPLGKFRYGSTSASLSLTLAAPGNRMAMRLWFSYLTLLLVTVFTQALFALMGSDLVSFTFFSARHIAC